MVGADDGEVVGAADVDDDPQFGEDGDYLGGFGSLLVVVMTWSTWSFFPLDNFYRINYQS
jgi:hypothetical protein